MLTFLLEKTQTFPLNADKMLLALLLFFLSPPKKLPIWSMSPGFFFFLPSPKVLCPEVLAVAMPMVAKLGRGWPLFLSQQFSAHRTNTLLLLHSAVQLFWCHLWRCCSPSPGAPWEMRRVTLACVQTFFGASVVVSVTAALCIVPLHLFHPGHRDNKGYHWVYTHTLMQSSNTVRSLYNQPHTHYFLNEWCLY